VSNLLGNAPLEQAMFECWQRLGPPPFDEADRAFARKIQGTLSDEDIATAYRRVGVPKGDAALCDRVVPMGTKRTPMVGSTDVGDVSWVVPTVQAHCSTYAIGTPGHSWQLTAQGKTPAAHKGMAHVAKIMAATGVQAITDPTLIPRAKADLEARTTDHPYACPIPADIGPPLDMAAD
jgi:aminobenzoyl-glutamate utilization protein B